jgi:citrate lyase subunit gamma (acyl carrier protein)
MEILTNSYAGSLESGDAFVQVQPNSGGGITLELKSSVERQFGDQIKAVAFEVLKDLKVSDARISIDDKGALDPIINARVSAAVYRAAKSDNFHWKE